VAATIEALEGRVLLTAGTTPPANLAFDAAHPTTAPATAPAATPAADLTSFTPAAPGASASSGSVIGLSLPALAAGVPDAVYEIQRATAVGTFATIVSTTASSYNDTGLDPATFYRYRIRADSSSLSQVSNWSPLTNCRTLGYGDANGDYSVDFFDIVALLASHYNTGQPATWADGDVNGDGVVDFFDITEILASHFNTGNYDVEINAGLTHDNGFSATDGLTNDPSVSGRLLNPNGSTLKAGIDDQPVSAYVSIAADTNPNGTFALSAARLAQIAGGPLGDGPHTLHVVAYDGFQNAVASQDLSFTLDTQPPAAPVFDLAAGYAVPAVGGQTTFRAPSLAGTTEPGARVTLGTGPTAITVTADSNGNFTLPDATLSPGANQVTLTATDAAGNTSTYTKAITRIVPTTANQVAIDWDNATLNAIVLDASAPPVANRSLAMVSGAMYDAVNSVNGASSYLYVHVAAPASSSDIAAVAQAAHDVLVYLYPGQQVSIDTQLTTSLASVTDDTAKANGISVGQQVAAAIIAQRQNDGATNFVDYTPGTGPGQWQPTYPSYAPALLPNWATLKPFLMTSDSQFRPAGPESLSSSQWQTDYNQVKSLGSATSTTRTADQTQIAKFWNDGVGTPTPAGHWNQIALQLIQARGGVSLFDTLKLLAELNTAMGDAAIVAWDAKYTNSFWRPITAIQAGGGNAGLTADPNWVPLLNTPNFPEYVSGHSTFSAAAAAILGNYFGQNFAFSTGSPSPGMTGITRSYASFTAAAQEAGMSRIYGGIHYMTSNLDGQAAGTALGNYVLQKFADTTDTTPPTVSVTNTPNQAYKTNPTINGLVTDNLSGVKSLIAQLDGGAPINVSVDSSGHFAITTALATDGTADGSHILHLIATDYAGNVAAGVNYSFTLDTLAPTISLTTPAGTQPIAMTPAGTTLSGTALGTGSALASLNYRLDNGMTMPLPFDPATGSFSQPLDLSKLTTGAHTLSVTAADAAGNVTTTTLNVTMPTLAPLTVSSFTPTQGASDVGATYRPEVFFSRPINAATLNASNFFATDSTGTKLAATIVPSNDGTYAWLFLTNPMQGASTIIVTVDGTSISAADGTKLDAAGTGAASGSKLTYSFTTVSTAALPGTMLSGIVADPGPDLKPGTPDDVLAGPDGVLMTADDVYKLPIAGVTVTIAGTSLTTTTDSQGRFSFSSVPSGDVKLVVTGTTATNPSAGFYFPEMVMDLNVLPGVANTVMAAMARSGTGNMQPGQAVTNAPGVYLPRLQTSLLQTVSSGTGAHITTAAVNAPDLTSQQRAMLSMDVPANSIIGTNGQPMSNAQIGVSTVDPSLVMDMLPAGVMQHTFDITVQAPGVATFSTPVAMTFPNVFNAAPGTKLDFLSFDHTTGRLVIEGTATVSADGLSVHTDPGVGVTHPGWHGLTPPGGKVAVKCKDGTGSKDNCDALGMALDVGAIAVGVAGLVVAPVVLGWAGLGIAAVQTGLAIYNNGGIDALTGLGDGVGGAGLGFSIVEPKATAGGIAGLARIVGFSSADGRTSLFRNLNAIAGNGIVSKSLGILGSLLSAVDLGFKISDCLGIPPPPAAAAPAASTPLTDLVSQLDVAFNGIFDSINTLIGDALAPLLPTDRGVALELSGDTLTALETDGTPYVNPATGKPFSVSFSSLFSPKWYSDPQFRQVVTSGLGNALISIGSILSNDNPTFVQAVSIIQSEYQTALAEIGDDMVVSLTGTAPYYLATDLDTGTVVAQGRLVGDSLDLFAPAGDTVRLEFVDPSNLDYGRALVTVGKSGSTSDIGTVYLSPDVTGDRDGDGLGNLAEHVIGTDPLRAKTGTSGISDGLALEQGLNPLAGTAFPTGVIATLPLAGQAKAIDVEASSASASGQTAFVATGSAGLAVVDTSQFNKPSILSQLSLPGGDATDVAEDLNLQIAAVADNAGGLVLVNIANPQQPTIIKTINVSASHVRVKDGVAYVAVGSQIQAYDLQTGDWLQSLNISGGTTLTGLAREGQMLYTMDSSKVLRAIDASGPTLALKGALTLPDGGGALFVANGIAYASAATNIYGGYVTASVANPAALTLIQGAQTASNSAGPNPYVVANGSGLGIMAVGGGRGVSPSLYVLSASDPTKTNQFVTAFPLPQVPLGVTVAAGIAYVADGGGGLEVVNYEPFDGAGIPPTASIDTTALDTDPNTAGVQVTEGSILPIKAIVSDDVQVRDVALLVNGTVVQDALSFPYNLTATMPTLASGATTATIQLRVTDTGGNVTTTAPTTLNLVRDTVPPQVISVNPPNGAIRGQNFRTIQIGFSKTMDPSTLVASNFTLTVGGNVITPIGVELRNHNSLIQITYGAVPVGAGVVTINAAAIKDAAGNVLGTSANQTISQFTVKAGTAVFINPNGGFWDDPANWDTGFVPGPSDDVLLDTGNPNATITFRTGNVTVRSLTSNNPFTLSGGALTVNGSVQVNGTFTIAGGTLANATVQPGSGGQGITFTSGGTLRGVTVNCTMDLSQQQNANVRVYGGLTLNGTMLLGNAAGTTYGRLYFADSSSAAGSLLGNATVVFGGWGTGGNFIENDSNLAGAAGTLTFGPSVTVRGKTGQIYSTYNNGGLVNQGTIGGDAGSGGTILFGANGGSVSNAGTIVVNGTTLSLGGSLTLAGLGTITRTGGTVNLVGSLDLGGGTLNLNAATGSWNLMGGTIQNGTIAQSNAAVLVVTNAGGNTLTNMTVNGDLDVSQYQNANLRVYGSLTLNGSLLLGNAAGSTYGRIYFADGNHPAGALTGNATVIFGGWGAGGNFIENDSNLTGAAGTLTLGPSVTVRGRNGAVYSYYNNGSLVNQGTISGDAGAGGAIQFGANGGSVSNSGTIVLNGTTLTLAGTWTLAGLGSFTRSGGTINFSGTLDLGGSTWNLTAATGSWNLMGGTIQNGAIAESGGSLLVITNTGGNTLTNMTVNGDLDASQYQNANLRVYGGLTLNGNLLLGNAAGTTYGRLYFADNATAAGALLGNATVIFGGWRAGGNFIENDSNLTGAAGTLILGPSVTVHGMNGSIYSTYNNGGLVNQGTIGADAGSGGTIQFGANGGAVNNATGTIIVNGTTLSLGGSLTLAGLGTITRSGGTVNLLGTLDLGGGTLNLNAATGSWNLGGGTIKNGTIAESGGSVLVISNTGGNTLTNMTVNGDLDVSQQQNSNLRIYGGLTLNGNLLLGNAAGTTYGRVYFADNATAAGGLLGNATVVFGGWNLGGNFIENDSNLTGVAGTLTLGPTVTVRGKNGSIYSYYNNGSLINQGTINGDAGSGGTIQFGGNGGSVTNAGAMIVSGTTLSLYGSWTLAGLGTITRSGGTVNWSGTLDLGGGTLNLNAASGSWNLLGGTIRNGTIAESGGAVLVITNTGGNTLTNMTVNGDLDASQYQNANLRVYGGLTLNGNLLLGNAAGTTYGRLYFADSSSAAGSLLGNATVIFGGWGAGGNFIENDSNLTGAAGTLILGPNVAVHGSNGSIYSYYNNGGLVNQGTISADAGSGGTVQIGANAGSVVNAGTIVVNGTALSLYGSWTLAGLGTITRSGGTITFGGTLDLGGSTLNLSAASGSWNLLGGTIKNGTIAESGGSLLLITNTGGNTLTNMTVNGDLDASQYQNANLRVYGGLTLNGNLLLGNAAGTTYGRLYFADSTNPAGSLLGSATVIFGGWGAGGNFIENDSNLTGAAGTLTFGPNVTIRGTNGQIYSYYGNGALLNQGTVSADVAGGTVQVGAGAASVVVNAGSLSSANGGTVSLIGVITNSGLVSPGGDGSPGKVTITGTYAQTSAGTLNIDVGGPAAGSQFDQLVVTGAATLDGTVNISLINGYAPAPGTTFQFLSYASHTGSFATVVDTNIHDTVGFDLTYGAASATLTSKTVPAQAPPLAPQAPEAPEAPEAIVVAAPSTPSSPAPLARTPSRTFSSASIAGSASPANVPTVWEVGLLTCRSAPMRDGVFAAVGGRIFTSSTALQLKSVAGFEQAVSD
jgi:membrane-associated phospholipid phosphatase